MKKISILLIFGLAIALIFVSCDQRKAMERVLANQDMANTILNQLWEKPEMKPKMVDLVLKDPEQVNIVMSSLVADTLLASSLIDKMLASEWCKAKFSAKAKEMEKAARTPKK